MSAKKCASGRPNNLGNFLRSSRQQALRGRSMSLVRAADELGYDKNSIQAYEVGERLPDVQFLAHAASLYKKNFRFMVSLLLRDQIVRGSVPPVQDPKCVEAADQVKVMDHEKVLDPKSPLAETLNHELLANILHDVERVERKSRHHLLPKHKARIVSALYGLAAREENDLGIEYLMRVIREEHKEYLDE